MMPTAEREQSITPDEQRMIDEMERGVPGHPVFEIDLKDGRKIKIYANSMVEGLEGEIQGIGNRIPGLIGLRDNLFNYYSIPFKLS